MRIAKRGSVFLVCFLVNCWEREKKGERGCTLRGGRWGVVACLMLISNAEELEERLKIGRLVVM